MTHTLKLPFRVTLANQPDIHTFQASHRRQCHPHAEKKKKICECGLVIFEWYKMPNVCFPTGFASFDTKWRLKVVSKLLIVQNGLILYHLPIFTLIWFCTTKKYIYHSNTELYGQIVLWLFSCMSLSIWVSMNTVCEKVSYISLTVFCLSSPHV